MLQHIKQALSGKTGNPQQFTALVNINNIKKIIICSNKLSPSALSSSLN